MTDQLDEAAVDRIVSAVRKPVANRAAISDLGRLRFLAQRDRLKKLRGSMKRRAREDQRVVKMVDELLNIIAHDLAFGEFADEGENTLKHIAIDIRALAERGGVHV